MAFIDIGVNLTNSRFDKDRAQVIANAKEVGVTHLIITGTNAQESQQAYQLTQDFDNCYATAGCHPHDSERMTADDFELIKHLLKHEKVVAVGECGLDFNRNFSPQPTQVKVFEQQLALACKLNKPLFLHERDASTTMIDMLNNHSNLPPAVIHCFTGSQQALESYLSLGLYIGITGWVCDERRGQELAEIVHLIPDDRLMIETDAPYLIPRNIRPRPKSNRCLPQHLPYVAQKLAECRQQTIEHISKITCQNSIDFFAIKPCDTQFSATINKNKDL
ncbi:MAG: TatD family hydrolase [Kangiellaceae bacterium]|nr:TatD family hydrolase [Kangiellaceae bacterium]